jgi:hypothetical protein
MKPQINTDEGKTKIEKRKWKEPSGHAGLCAYDCARVAGEKQEVR